MMMRPQHPPVIEGYQILHEIGRGGVGVVYSAVDLSSHQHVAIKVLSQRDSDRSSRESDSQPTSDDSSLGDSSSSESSLSGSWFSENLSAQRLFQELAATTRVKHPHAAQVLDFGVSDHQELYVVMELLVGSDMSTFLKRNSPLPLATTLRLFCEMLGALTLAHDQKILHRDIKPANLFITHPERLSSQLIDEAPPRFVVMDFGIARRIQHKQHKQQLVGSLPYMAPEYLQRGEVTPAGDVYQLGLTLVELITGVRVVNGKGGMAIMYQHIKSELAIPAPLKRGALGEVIMRSVALDPQRRYPDARALSDALSALSPLEVERVAQEMSGLSAPVDKMLRPVSASATPQTTPQAAPQATPLAPPLASPLAPPLAPPLESPLAPSLTTPQAALLSTPQARQPTLSAPVVSPSLANSYDGASSRARSGLDLQGLIEQSDLRAEIERLSKALEQEERSSGELRRQLERRVKLLSLVLVGLSVIVLITLSLLLGGDA